MGVSPEQDLPWISGNCLGIGWWGMLRTQWLEFQPSEREASLGGRKMWLSTGNPEPQQHLKTPTCVSSLKELSAADFKNIEQTPATINQTPTWPRELVTCISCDTRAIRKHAQEVERKFTSLGDWRAFKLLFVPPWASPRVRVSWMERLVSQSRVLAETRDWTRETTQEERGCGLVVQVFVRKEPGLRPPGDVAGGRTEVSASPACRGALGRVCSGWKSPGSFTGADSIATSELEVTARD